MEYVKGKVSVIIPTYRRSDTLARAIKSVAEQTYKDIEILVVDDNEPGDEYSKRVTKLIKELPYENLVLVTQERHINGAAARNAGIRKAIGEYISFLDDDDVWMPTKIQMQIEQLKKLDKSYGGISTRKIYYVNGKQDRISGTWKPKNTQHFDVMSRRLNVSTCTVLLKRTCLDETGYFDEKLKRHQEVQLFSYFTSKYKIGFINEILTIIDCSDTANRPSASVFLKYKEAYFNSIKELLEQQGAYRRNLIIASNMTENAWAFYRDGEKIKGLCMLLRYLIYPSVLVGFLSRLFNKKNGKKLLHKYDRNVLNNIQKYIESIT